MAVGGEAMMIARGMTPAHRHLRSRLTLLLAATVALAVSEATTNVVVHAYRDRDEPGTFTLGLDIECGSLMIDVCDDGLGPAPRTDSPGLGLGLPLIAQMTDGFEVHEADTGGTEVRMRFAL